MTGKDVEIEFNGKRVTGYLSVPKRGAGRASLLYTNGAV